MNPTRPITEAEKQNFGTLISASKADRICLVSTFDSIEAKSAIMICAVKKPMQLNLPPSTEALLRQHAAAAGKDVEAFAIQVLQQQLGDEEQAKPLPRNHDDWVAALTAWSNSHPQARRNVDASRESSYEGRGL